MENRQEVLEKLKKGFGSKPQKPDAKSHLNKALSAISAWNEDDREFFIAVFSGKKSAQVIANEFGITDKQYIEKKRYIVRRFMYGSQFIL